MKKQKSGQVKGQREKKEWGADVYTVQEAQNKLPELCRRAAAGEEFFIRRYVTIVARIGPVSVGGKG